MYKPVDKEIFHVHTYRCKHASDEDDEAYVNGYPSPVLHANSLSPDARVQVTLPTSRTLTKEKETRVKEEMNIHTKAQELAGKIFECKKQKRSIDNDIHKLERELGALFDSHGIEFLELPMGVLTRRKSENGVEWVIEI